MIFVLIFYKFSYMQFIRNKIKILRYRKVGNKGMKKYKLDDY